MKNKQFFVCFQKSCNALLYKQLLFISLMTLIISVSHADINVLTNPGFEDGTTGWLSRNDSIMSITSPVYSGLQAGRAYDRTATWQGIQQDITDKVILGQTYQVSGWVRLENASSDSMVLTIQQEDSSGTNYHRIDSITATNSNWYYLSGNYTVNVDGALTRLMVYFEGPQPGINFFVDDAVVYGPEPGSVETTASVNTSVRHQQLEGFGAAGAWYGGWLTAHPQRTVLYDILFNQLGLDIYRIRNTYEIDADEINTSVEIIEAAENILDRPLKIMISSWSPPARLKSNDDTVGGTLKKDNTGRYMYDEFAQWWSDSLAYYANRGVVAEYVNMQNEPDYLATWDTCKLVPTETTDWAGYNLAFEALYKALNGMDNFPKLLAPEAVGFNASKKYIDALIDRSHVYAYAHHLYGDGNGGEPDNYIAGMANFASQYSDKPRMQTEYSHDSQTYTDAMNLALLMHNSLTVEEVSMYMYWDLFWGTSGGLVTLDNPWQGAGYTINPVYYAFKHFSAFTDPGWQRVDASTNDADLRVSAFISPDNQHLSIIFINTNTASGMETDLSIDGFSIETGQIYQTTTSQNCAFAGSFDQPGMLMIPAYSIVTVSLVAAPPLYGDLTDDGRVNAEDLPGFLQYWLDTECGDMDLNGDCLINLYEFAEFANNWFMQ